MYAYHDMYCIVICIVIIIIIIDRFWTRFYLRKTESKAPRIRGIVNLDSLLRIAEVNIRVTEGKKNKCYFRKILEEGVLL